MQVNLLKLTGSDLDFIREFALAVAIHNGDVDKAFEECDFESAPFSEYPLPVSEIDMHELSNLLLGGMYIYADPQKDYCYRATNGHGGIVYLGNTLAEAASRCVIGKVFPAGIGYSVNLPDQLARYIPKHAIADTPNIFRSANNSVKP